MILGMDQETTDTQKQIIQHLHTLLEDTERWYPMSSGSYAHNSGLTIQITPIPPRFCLKYINLAGQVLHITDSGVYDKVVSRLGINLAPDMDETKLLTYLEALV